MKLTSIKQLLLPLFIAFSTYSVYAYDFEVDGIYYDVISTTELTCKVAKAKYTGDIIVPATVDYKNRSFQVVDINTAFKGSSISSISIPNTITTIEEYAFDACKSLTSVSLPKTITSIPYRAFSYCSSLTDICLPNTLTSIKASAFYSCNLKTIEIPTSVTEIGSNAFYECTSLTNIVLPNSVEILETSIFHGCRSLKSITLPSHLTEIRGNTFYKCNSLEAIELPETLLKIEYGAFYGCESLTKITIPNSVTTIGYEAFRGCSSMETIILSNKLESIPYGCFVGCKNLSGIAIPGAVENVMLWIQGYFSFATFKDCISLKNLKIEYSDKPLKSQYVRMNDSGQTFFYNCGWSNTERTNFVENLETVFIDRKLESQIPLPSLKELTIGEHLETVPVSNIKGCTALTTIISYADVPPVLPECSAKQYMDIIVQVPEELLETYKQADGWKNFWNIEAIGKSGVQEIQSVIEKAEIGRYNLLGSPVSEDYDGIVIVRYSDGSTRKVINK